MRLVTGILLGIGLCVLSAFVCGTIAVVNAIKSFFR